MMSFADEGAVGVPSDPQLRAGAELLSDDPAPLLNLSAALLALGDHRKALKAASDACHAAPNRPEAHYAYGQAWSALGNHFNAERAFAAAVQLAPRWADAWVNYGI